MFGVGIFEILVILIVAVIALGPNKLPQTIVDIVKFFRAVKKTMAEAKESFDKEIQLAEIKKETLKYKETITYEMNKITKDIELDELRQISVDSISKPLDELQSEAKPLVEEGKTLNSTLQSLNTEISYASHTQSADNKPADSVDSIESTKAPSTDSIANIKSTPNAPSAQTKKD
ncbi:Sec-independent protein translocase subunit TatB [Helicobacter jaachi]|uniref:Sec-independent protein translocase protein TatB homolog n=1 Tax=Helicobacter jaachi TaxID=1677920 RepID=A0A4U8T756_9HELI|nr:Sec-independent protein translocase protein TatB [Helicobacter jaachi]TLD95466.1 Sec-independent protein translocase subunit TatB [Helicobacter jaachi]